MCNYLFYFKLMLRANIYLRLLKFGYKNIKHNTLIHFVLLDVLPTELSKRLERRAEVEEHFMPNSLIESQLHDLEKPLINEGLGDRVILSVDE